MPFLLLLFLLPAYAFAQEVHVFGMRDAYMASVAIISLLVAVAMGLTSVLFYSIKNEIRRDRQERLDERNNIMREIHELSATDKILAGQVNALSLELPREYVRRTEVKELKNELRQAMLEHEDRESANMKAAILTALHEWNGREK